MVAPNYPSNPSLGQQFVVGNKTFEWDGEKWRALSNADASLRSQLAATDSTVLVGGEEARKLTANMQDGSKNGVVMDGVTDSTSAINTLTLAGGEIYLPTGTAIATGVTPDSGSKIKGKHRGLTTLKIGTPSSNLINITGKLDTEVADIRLQGLGKNSVTEESGVVYNGVSNARRNSYKNVDFTGFSNAALELSGGWGNVVDQCTFISNDVGLRTKISPQLAGWSGSGFHMTDSYIATCNTGIEMEAIWNFTSVNSVIEDCVLPINQTASATPAVWINTWFESNQQSPRLTYSNVFIGGRLEGGQSPVTGFYDNMSLPVAPFDNECITEIGKGISVFRDPLDQVFKADGQGVKFFKAHSSLGWSIEDVAGTTAKQISVGRGSGADGGGVTSTSWGATTGWVDITTLTGKRHFNSFDTTAMPKLGVKIQGNASSSGGGNGFTRVMISTGSYFTGGGGSTSFADRWMFDANGHQSPVTDNAYDIGIASFRVRDIRVVNAPIVGSDVRIKKDIQSIPQPLLDFALSVEIKQYKLKASQSGRNHYGIVITPEFLTALEAVQSIDECGAFCHDVFMDEEGNPVTRDFGGVELGDVWQVRYDEWQNILLEAMRRKVAAL